MMRDSGVVINRVFAVLEGRCYCGGQIVFAEFTTDCGVFETGEDGKVHFVREDRVTETGTLCTSCWPNGALGMPAECF